MIPLAGIVLLWAFLAPHPGPTGTGALILAFITVPLLAVGLIGLIAEISGPRTITLLLMAGFSAFTLLLVEVQLLAGGPYDSLYLEVAGLFVLFLAAMVVNSVMARRRRAKTE